MSTSTFFGTLNHVECAACHVSFGITSTLQSARREDHKTFYCPNGHSNVYRGDNAEEKLKKQLADANAKNSRLLQNTAYLEDRIKEEQEVAKTEKHRAAAFKGVLTKTKKRIQAGVCPCCNRSFVNLAHHMKHQHKDYATQEIVT